MRYVEIGWGKLLGEKSKGGRGKKAAHAGAGLQRDLRKRFYRLAACEATLLPLIQKARDVDEVTRAARSGAGTPSLLAY